MLLVLCVTLAVGTVPPYEQSHTDRYLTEFPTLVGASWQQPLPPALAGACAGQGSFQASLPETLAGTSTWISAADAARNCGAASLCVVPSQSTLLMDSSLNVAALLVRGAVLWGDSAQAATWLCSGFIAVASGGQFNMSVTSGDAYMCVLRHELPTICPPMPLMIAW